MTQGQSASELTWTLFPLEAHDLAALLSDSVCLSALFIFT
jgi:hypothetical protein